MTKETIRRLSRTVALLACVGCGKLLATAEKEEDASAAQASPSAVASDSDDGKDSGASAAASVAAPGVKATTRPGRDPKTGACLKGWTILGPPTTPNQPCVQTCAAAAECAKGQECHDEDAFGRGTIKVCGAPAAKTAGGATANRFIRDTRKEGDCPSGFACENPFDGRCTCARICKGDDACGGFKCKDGETSDSKVCSTEKATASKPAASKCKGGEIEIDGQCMLQCTGDAECGSGGHCLPTQFQDPSAGLVRTSVCQRAEPPKPGAKPAATASVPKPAPAKK